MAVVILAGVVAVFGSPDAAIGILMVMFGPLAVVALTLEVVALTGKSNWGGGWSDEIDW